MRSVKYLSALFFAALTLTLISCSKTETGTSSPSTSSQAWYDSELGKKLPSTALGFLSWRTSTDAYKRFRTTPWGGGNGQSSFVEGLKSLASGEQGKDIAPFVDVLLKTGLIPSSPNQPEAVKEGTAFVSFDQSKKLPGAGLYLAANSGTNLEEKLAAIQKVFEAQGYTVNKQKVGGIDGFAIPLRGDVSAQSPIKNIYFAANKDFLAAGTSEALCSGLFGKDGGGGLTALQGTPEFKRALTLHTQGDDQFTFAYLDIKRLVQGVYSAAPQEVKDKGDIKPDDIPLEALALSRSMQKGLSDLLTVSVTPHTDVQKKWVSSLTSGGKVGVTKQVPPDVILLIGLDGQVLSKVKEAALQEMPPAEAAQAKEQLKLLDSLSSLGVGLLNSSGASPFPGVLLLAESSQADQLRDTLKTMLMGAMASGGMPAGQWQEKDVSGSKVSYILSPLGVGAYLASANGVVLATTSEKAMSDSIAAVTGKNGGLASNLSEGAKKLVNEKSPLLVAYMNFQGLSDMIQSAQGSLAMFTGGKPAVENKQLEDLKQMGIVTFSANFTDNVLKINTNYDESPKKGG